MKARTVSVCSNSPITDRITFPKSPKTKNKLNQTVVKVKVMFWDQYQCLKDFLSFILASEVFLFDGGDDGARRKKNSNIKTIF